MRTRALARTYRAALLFGALALGFAYLAGCDLPSSGVLSAGGSDDGTPIELDGVEVAEYRGENLSSVNDFRENSISGPQFVDRNTYRLSIEGMVDRESALSYDEVIDRQTYEKVVTLDCVEGWSVDILWEGVLVRDLIDEAGVDPDANTLILRAVDGYSTSLPLGFFYDNDILLAFRVNGVTLPPERGFPFQLVAEDKWGYKWIKWVDEIEVSDDLGFEGYWESRGYSNEGDAGGAIFGD